MSQTKLLFGPLVIPNFNLPPNKILWRSWYDWVPNILLFTRDILICRRIRFFDDLDTIGFRTFYCSPETCWSTTVALELKLHELKRRLSFDFFCFLAAIRILTVFVCVLGREEDNVFFTSCTWMQCIACIWWKNQYELDLNLSRKQR